VHGQCTRCTSQWVCQHASRRFLSCRALSPDWRRTRQERCWVDIGAVNGQACEAAGGARDEGGRGGCRRWQCSSAATAGAVQTRATAGAAHRPWWGPGAVPRAPRLAHKRRRAKQASKQARQAGEHDGRALKGRITRGARRQEDKGPAQQQQHAAGRGVLLYKSLHERSLRMGSF
jgi:hypothetical protein